MAKTTKWLGGASGATGDFDTADNWSNGVPTDTDTAIFDGDAAYSLDDGLNQSAITLAELRIYHTVPAAVLIGTEAAYFQIGATKVVIGEHDGSGNPTGSGRIKLDLGAAQTAVEVYDTADTPEDDYLLPVRLKMNHGSSTVRVYKGAVSIADGAGETSTLATAYVDWRSSQAGDARLVIGSGVTLTTLAKTGGDCVLKCAATTVTNGAGTLQTRGTGAIGTLNANGGTVYPESTGTITVLNLNGGTTDFGRSSAARTVTTPTIKAGASLRYDPAVVTFTNKLTAGEAVLLTADAA